MYGYSMAKEDQFNDWLHQINKACGSFGAEPLDSDFAGSIREHRSGSLKLSIVEVASARLYRSKSELLRSDGDHFYAAFQLNGSAFMEQGDSKAALEQGDVILIDSTKPSEFHYRSGSRQLSLILPRKLVEQNLRFARIRCGERISASSPVAAMAHRLILDSMSQPNLSRGESEAALDAVVSLLRPAITGADVETDPHERLFSKAVAFIDQHICCDTLCPELVAKEVGVSVRGLYRIFSKKGLVVAQYIKARRLDLCAESLRQSGSQQKLSALGYFWGFVDSSHFCSAFKARFGVPPGEYRKRYHNAA
jgi:AraC family transcriptional activator of tynA and feaB